MKQRVVLACFIIAAISNIVHGKPPRVVAGFSFPAQKASVFESWADEAGIKRSKVVVTDTQGMRGALATQPIGPKDIVVEVPSSMSLQVTNDKPNTPFPDFCPQDTWKSLKWDGRLAMLLLHAKHSRDDAKKLGVWLNSLPEHFASPLHWNDAAMNELQYEHVRDQVLQQRVQWRSIYDNWSALAPKDFLSRVPFSEFVWAMDCVRSRAFSGAYEGSSFNDRLKQLAFVGTLVCVWPLLHLGTMEQALSAGATAVLSILAQAVINPRLFPLKRYVLCPYVDMFNHKGDVASDVSYDFFADAFLLKTGAFQEGDQVFISYGTQSNDRLLQYYGFVEPDNIHDVYNFNCDFFELLDKHANVFDSYIGGDKLDLVESLTVRMKILKSGISALLEAQPAPSKVNSNFIADASQDKQKHFVTVSRATGSFDDITRRCVCSLLMSSEEWSTICSQAQTPERVISAVETIMPNYNPRITSCLQNVAQAELERFPTTLQQDEQQFSAISQRRGRGLDDLAMALQFRIEKKKLLEQALSPQD